MVEEITLFEPHFDGRSLGPLLTGDEASEDDGERNETSEESRGQRSTWGRLFRGVAVGLAVLLAAELMLRWRSASEDEDVGENTLERLIPG